MQAKIRLSNSISVSSQATAVLLYRPFDFYKGLMRFSRPGKRVNILEPILAGWITSVRSTNSRNLMHIGCEIAPPHMVVKYNGFGTFFSRLFSFFPFHRPAHRSRFGSELHAWCLKSPVLIDTCAFWGFGAFKFTMMGSPVQNNRQILTRKRFADFLQKNRFNIRGPGSRLNYL